MCCSLWFLSLRLVLRYFSTVYPVPTYEKYFSTVLPNLPIWAELVVCCSFVIPFFTFGLRVFFQQSYPISTYEAGIEWCAFVIPFFVFGLRYFSTVLPNFYLWKQGLSDVLLFVIPSVFGLKSIFNSPTQFLPMKAGDWVMCCSFVIPFFVFGLRVFSTVLISTYKQGLSDVLLLCDSFLCVWS
jgi:hypothetical protein